METIVWLVALVAIVFVTFLNKTSPLYKSGMGYGIEAVSETGKSLYELFFSPENLERCKKDHKLPDHTLLMSVYDTMNFGESACLEIYQQKESGTFSVVDHKNKVYSVKPFLFDCGPMNIDTYKYQPEKIVYTGATVGGVHTGGFHTEQAHYRQSKVNSGNGIVFCNYAKDMPYFLALRVKLNDELLKKAEDDDLMRTLLDSNKQLVFMNVGGGAAYYEGAKMAAHSGRRYDFAEMSSRGASEKALPMETCIKVADWLTEAAHGRCIPTQPNIFGKIASKALDIINFVGS